MWWKFVFLAVIPFYLWLFWTPFKHALNGELDRFHVIWLLLTTVAIIFAAAYLPIVTEPHR